MSGETITQAVLHALEERLERLRGHRDTPDLVETLLTISNRCGALPDLDDRNADDILGYGADGEFR